MAMAKVNPFEKFLAKSKGKGKGKGKGGGKKENPFAAKMQARALRGKEKAEPAMEEMMR